MSIKRFSVSELHSERHSWHKTFQNAHTHKNTHITQELHPFQSPPLTPTTHSVSDDVIYHSLCSTATEKWFVQQVCTCACVSVKLMRSRSIFWAWCHLSLTNPPWTRWTNRTPKGGKEESTGGKRRTENGVRVCVCVCVLALSRTFVHWHWHFCYVHITSCVKSLIIHTPSTYWTTETQTAPLSVWVTNSFLLGVHAPHIYR